MIEDALKQQLKLIEATNAWLKDETNKYITSPVKDKNKLVELQSRHRQLIKDIDRLIEQD